MGFTDLLSSSRGPGVIGTVIALFVLVGFGTLYMFVFDEGLQGGQKTIQAVIRDQGTLIETHKIQRENYRKRIEDAERFNAVGKEANDLKLRADNGAKRVVELTAAKEAAVAGIGSAKDAWAKYRDDYRASEWAAAVGEKFAEIKTRDGEVFTNVAIRKVSHKGVDISHQNGLKLLVCEELPADLQDRFQFDAEKTEEDAKTTGVIVGIHADNVAISNRVTKANGKLERVNELKGEVQRLGGEIEAARLNGPRHDAEISRQQMAINAEKSKVTGISNAPQMEARLAEMKKAAEKSRNSISTNEAKLRQATAEIETLNREVAGLKAEIETIKNELKQKNPAPKP
jgi:chromosome segregation ATPase